VLYDVRKLSIGDYLWICKPKASSGTRSDRELVLPYVVERKRMDDLVSSIKDGRFKEQKVNKTKNVKLTLFLQLTIFF
jgi:crossover junction endonuclease MUS81